jgi:hypothetical protein
LLAREEDLVGEVRTLLSNVNLQYLVSDGYTVRGVYPMLMR